MTATIATRKVNGRPCVISVEAVITSAQTSNAPLTITTGPMAGDKVWIGRVGGTSIATQMDHPDHGVVVTAWIDTARLQDAPRIAAAVTAQNTAVLAAYRDTTVPACDNCGDCPRCI